MAEIKLVIFDFDDTIVRLEIPWNQVKDEAITMAAEYGITVDRNLPMMEIANELDKYPDAKEPLYYIFRRYESRCTETFAYNVYPGMRELLTDLNEKGYRIAIASANCVPTIERVLGAMNLLGKVHGIAGRETADKNKPAPDQLNIVLNLLHFDKENALFVGDSIYDEEAAKAAGVKFFSIKGHGPKVEELRKMLLD